MRITELRPFVVGTPWRHMIGHIDFELQPGHIVPPDLAVAEPSPRGRALRPVQAGRGAMTTSPAGRLAVVTGGGRGIGAATAAVLADAGARVAVLDLDAERAEAVAAGLAGEALSAGCDITDERSVTAAFARVRSERGLVAVLVNNAGVNTYFDPGEMTLEDWEQAFAVDLRGAWLCVKHALADLRAADGASVVNVASIHATLTSPGMFPYAAAKAGLVGMTRSLALDLGPDGIRVNAVSPGFTRTRLVEEWLDLQPDPQATRASVLRAHAIGRMVELEEVGRLIAFLASDDAAAITGTEIHIDGGHSARFAA